jgi:hypothetical protein
MAEKEFELQGLCKICSHKSTGYFNIYQTINITFLNII